MILVKNKNSDYSFPWHLCLSSHWWHLHMSFSIDRQKKWVLYFILSQSTALVWIEDWPLLQNYFTPYFKTWSKAIPSLPAQSWKSLIWTLFTPREISEIASFHSGVEEITNLHFLQFYIQTLKALCTEFNNLPIPLYTKPLWQYLPWQFAQNLQEWSGVALEYMWM